MNRTPLPVPVGDAIEYMKTSLMDKGFTIFADIDHRANAQTVDLDMPDARVLIFGNPLAGTKLMQQDLLMSFSLPLRLAVIDSGGKTLLLHLGAADYAKRYQVQGHPVLEKIDQLFSSLVVELSSGQGAQGMGHDSTHSY